MIIGISGILEDNFGNKCSAGSGKDTVADILCEYGFIKLALADPIKRICMDVFGFNYNQMFGPSEFRNVPNEKGIIPRSPLKGVGSACRDENEDVWIDYCLNDIDKLLSNNNLTYFPSVGVTERYENTPFGLIDKCGNLPETIKGVVVADCRFKNELFKIKNSKNGKLLRVKRKINTNISSNKDKHQSEIDLLDMDDSIFDYIIDNNGSLEDLSLKIRRFIEANNLI